MPTISPFRLDGNHFGVWSPQPINNIKPSTNLLSKHKAQNIKLLSKHQATLSL